MCKAARKILDGDAEGLPHPSLEEQVAFWGELLQTSSTEFNELEEPIPEVIHKEVIRPITVSDVVKGKPDRKTAPGPDGLKAKTWINEVKDMVKAIVMNIMLLWGQIPRIWRDSRTILIPKQ